ncbi:hypothetical protein AWJ20_3534 [Sugiyamaella lignohabitans]|uniref:EVE domain-containing protein n=1 Tax=Sugiyamaella lignohabitans TaxID=796027 RepID=A0A161HI36_9ASCO|nr:uncharacterized protein AWJ20_3534 [Sugiyamaella lignohabitans]ANB15890.1 hypothetical protein AWJ20_3534 [Sugiyamaella lignohabitans]
MSEQTLPRTRRRTRQQTKEEEDHEPKTKEVVKNDKSVKRAKKEQTPKTLSTASSTNAKAAPKAAGDEPDRPRYWLLKAEPETRVVDGHDVKFSIDDLKDMKVSPWDGVRNYEARNNMRAMKQGELAFFYHSNCKVPGIVGIMKIHKEAYVDCEFNQNPMSKTATNCCLTIVSKRQLTHIL